MIKNRFLIIISAVVLSVLFSSCKKDSNQGEIDRGLIEAYVLDNNLDGQFTSSGLYYVIELPGASDLPTVNSNVTVSYKGYTLDDSMFDEGDYLTSKLSGLIVGWQEGIQLIGEGGKIKLVIPSGLAYGSNGYDSIGSNEVLVFDITLHYFSN